MRKIYVYEPWFFIFFGIFHLHRIWGLIDRKSYADFWIGILEQRGIFYYSLMGFWYFFVSWVLPLLYEICTIIIGGGGYLFLVVVICYLIYLLLQ